MFKVEQKIFLNASKRKLVYSFFGIVAFLSFAVFLLFIIDEISYNKVISFFSLPSSMNIFLTQPYRLVLPHLVIGDWVEVLICVFVFLFFINNKRFAGNFNLIYPILVFQIAASLLCVVLLKAFDVNKYPLPSVVPSLIALLLFVNWKGFNENVFRIPFTVKHIPFYLLWFALIAGVIFQSIINNKPEQTILLVATIVVSYVVALSFYYFSKKVKPSILDNYLQVEFKKAEIVAAETYQFDYSGTSKKEYLDFILDKINKVGIHNLSARESYFLNNFSNENKTK